MSSLLYTNRERTTIAKSIERTRLLRDAKKAENSVSWVIDTSSQFAARKQEGKKHFEVVRYFHLQNGSM